MTPWTVSTSGNIWFVDPAKQTNAWLCQDFRQSSGCLTTENWCILPGQRETPENFKHLHCWVGGTRTQCCLRHQAVSSSQWLQPSVSNLRIHLSLTFKANLSWQAQWSSSNSCPATCSCFHLDQKDKLLVDSSNLMHTFNANFYPKVRVF